MSLPTTSSLSPEQLQAMGDQLQSLTRRVEQLEAKSGVHPASSEANAALQAAVAKAAKFAEEIFNCPVQIEQDYDPESPDWSWYNVCVTTNVNHEQLMNLRHQWYDRLSTFKYDDPTTIRLFVTFPE